jgi:hypothetical protein
MVQYDQNGSQGEIVSGKWVAEDGFSHDGFTQNSRNLSKTGYQQYINSPPALLYDIYIYKIVPMIRLLSTFSVVHEILVEDVFLQCVYHTTGSTTWRYVNLRPKGTHLFGGYIVPPFISRNNQDI